MTAPLDNQQAHWREVLWPIRVNFPGEEGIVVPSGATAQRPVSPEDGYLRYNSNLVALEARIGGVWTTLSTAAAPSFLSLTDTPANYTGLASQTLRINIGENGLEFTAALKIETSGLLNVAGTTNYETLVVTDDSIPNKKYVDDQDDLRVAVAGDFMNPAANLVQCSI